MAKVWRRRTWEEVDNVVDEGKAVLAAREVVPFEHFFKGFVEHVEVEVGGERLLVAVA